MVYGEGKLCNYATQLCASFTFNLNNAFVLFLYSEVGIRRERDGFCNGEKAVKVG